MSEQPHLPTVAEAEQRLACARDALADAHEEVTLAQRAYDEARGRAVEGQALARLALEGNPTAMRLLDEQVRALHPGIAGYLPVPNNNDDPGWFRRPLEDLGLRLELPEQVDADYAAGLAVALRDFVRHYEPKINHPNTKSGTQGYAYAETRAGRLAYPLRRTRPTLVHHLEGVDGTAQPDERFATLEEALMALPSLVFLAALGGRSNLAF